MKPASLTRKAIASIARVTGDNFRLLHRLFVQIERILSINGLSVITDDLVEAAPSNFVIGTTWCRRNLPPFPPEGHKNVGLSKPQTCIKTAE
jgi:hypothetical protein